tara:strand:- start:1095 stop:1541 length:447 start_codon:yes stop_codon:yes gene_type:complete
MWEKREDNWDLQGNPNIGKKLRDAREALGMSGAAVAKAAGLASAQTLYGYESDRREPDFSSLLRLCAALELTPNDLFSFPDFDRQLMAEIMVAVDDFMVVQKRKVESQIRSQLCFAVYDALVAEPDKVRDQHGNLDLSELMGLMRLAL